MKRLISLLLALMMLVSIVPQMGAAPSVMETEATEQTTIESPASDADEGGDVQYPAVIQFYRAKKLQEGDRVIIVCHSRNIALSAEYDGNYNAGVPVEPMDGIITSYDYSIVWTVGRYWDYYTFSYEGKNLSMEDQYYSMCLGEQYDTWEILPGTTAGTFYVRNVDRMYNGNPLYIEWYEKLEQWTAYMNPTEELMTLSFYVYGSCYHVMDEGTVTKEATCTEAGTVLYSCEYCMETYTEDVAPTGIHNYEDRICTVCGAEEPMIPTDSGITGEVNWAFYEDMETLVIYGQGAMENYTKQQKSPWYTYKNNIGTVVIEPGVENIGEYAFYDHDSMKTISLPDTLLSIGKYAFYYCDSVTHIDFPESLVSIGDSAFSECTLLGSVKIPNSVTELGMSAFYHCFGLQSVILGDGLTTVPYGAFSSCTGVIELTIGKNVTTIGDSAFSNCNSLETVYIPEHVSSMNGYSFRDCDNLTRFEVAENNPYFTTDSRGAVLSKDGTRLTIVPSGVGGEYVVPDGVTTIVKYAMNCNKKLTDIIIGDSVTTIENYACWDCDMLKTVVIGNGVKEIGANAFYNCAELETVKMGTGVETIGKGAFRECPKMKEIILPDSLKTLGKEAFMRCIRLERVVFGNGLTEIQDKAFENCSDLRNLYIPSGVTYIGAYAFDSCYDLYHIHFLGNMPTMGEAAFKEENYDGYDGLFDPLYPQTFLYVKGTEGWENCKYNMVMWEYTCREYCDGDFYQCPGCSTEYIASKDGVHTWDEGNLAVAPNCVSDGILIYTCTTCGMEEVETPAANGEHNYVFYVCTYCAERDPHGPKLLDDIEINHTLNLESDIAINYLVREELLREYDSFYMECYIPVYEGNKQVDTQMRIIQPNLRGEYYYFILDGILSPEMNDTVKAWIRMSRGEEEFVSPWDKYSVATYAYKQLNDKSKPDALKAVCANLLQYGSAVQSWKGYRTNALADWAMTRAHRAYLTDLETVKFENNRKHLGDVAGATVTFRGISMQLGSKIAIRYVIDTANYGGNVEELSLRISYVGSRGEAKEAVVTELSLYHPTMEYYVFDFDGLLASELRAVMTVGVYAGETQVSETLQFSGDSYGVGREEPILTPVRAMIAYSDSTKAYFG